MQFVDLKKQYETYRSEIDSAINKVFEHGHFIMGQELIELEKKLAQFVEVEHCITTASGTASLEIALRALEIGPGDEVITVPFTWVSTAGAIELVGAKTVFVDIEPDTYNMDMKKIYKIISKNTKAIIPVSLFGHMADLETVNTIGKEFDIPIIEDGAQSFGTTFRGKKSGSLTTVGSTSFFPAKPLGCYGDGGALFTNNSKLSEKMKKIRNHGAEKRHHYTFVGINGRLDTIQAAVLLAKLPYFFSEINRRERIGKFYSESLKEVCLVPTVREKNSHVYGQYTIRVNKRKEFQAELNKKGIPTAVYYPKCLHQQPNFLKLGYNNGDFPIAERAAKEVVSLPLHPFLSESDQYRVIDAVKMTLATI